MKPHRTKEIIFFEKQGIVEVRSQPTWTKVIEFWFIWWDEIFLCKFDIDRFFPVDRYWGTPFAAAWQRFHTWLINYDATIDQTAKFTDLVPQTVCDDCGMTDGNHNWDVEH